MTGVLEAATVVLLSAGVCKLTTDHFKKERDRLSIAQRIYREVLGRELDPGRPRARAGQPPPGADSGAAAALSAVQRWQDEQETKKGFSLKESLPTCSVGVFKVASQCGPSGPGVDAETAICEGLKPSLLAASSGAAAPREIEAALEFCFELLMRPETFSDPTFNKVIAAVTGHLERLSERVSGALRTCALELGKVLNLGRHFVDLVMPTLLLAVTDALGEGPLPHLNAETLSRSAMAQGRLAEGGLDVFAPFWRTDAGKLLRELLGTSHFRELCGLPSPPEKTNENKENAVRALALTIKHGDHTAGTLGWIDKLDGSSTYGLDSSGLCDLFRGQNSADLLDEAYLALFEQVDDLIKFLSMLIVYRRLANVGGDAAMCRINEGFHHVLSEIEGSLVRVRHLAARVGDAAQHVAVELAVSGATISQGRLLWIERLQNIDERAMDKSMETLFESIQEIRFLSSTARQRTLQGICVGTILQLSDITASSEFRTRCVLEPPSAVALADITQSAMGSKSHSAALQAISGSALSNPPELVSLQNSSPGAAPWCVERSFGVDSAYLDRRPDLLLCEDYIPLGDAVHQLNEDRLRWEGNLCIVRLPRDFGDLQKLAVLFKANAAEQVVFELGLEKPPDVPVDPLPVYNACIEEVDDLEPVEMSLPAEGAPKSMQTDMGDLTSPPRRLASAAEEERYYEQLLFAALPVFGDKQAMDFERLSALQVTTLLLRSGLSEVSIKAIVRTEGAQASINAMALQRLGRRVAEAQAPFLGVGSGDERPLPSLDGILWDGRRLRMLH